MMSPTGPAETRQGDGAPLKAEASVENHGPRAAGRRLAGDISDRPAETRRGSSAPLEMEASAGDSGLWAEDRGHGGPAAHGGPLLEDGMAGLPRKQEASGGIFQECTVAVEGHCNKFCHKVVESYK